MSCACAASTWCIRTTTSRVDRQYAVIASMPCTSRSTTQAPERLEFLNAPQSNAKTMESFSMVFVVHDAGPTMGAHMLHSMLVPPAVGAHMLHSMLGHAAYGCMAPCGMAGSPPGAPTPCDARSIPVLQRRPAPCSL